MLNQKQLSRKGQLPRKRAPHVFPPPSSGSNFLPLQEMRHIIDIARSNQFESIWVVVGSTLDTIPRWKEVIKGLNKIIMPVQEVGDSLHNAFGVNEIAFEVRHDIKELIVEHGMSCFELAKVTESISQILWPALALGALKRH